MEFILKNSNTNSEESMHPWFISALFTITKIWKQSKSTSVDVLIKKLWYIYAMEHYSAGGGGRFFPLWLHLSRMDLESIMISRTSQSEEGKYHMISLTCGTQWTKLTNKKTNIDSQIQSCLTTLGLGQGGGKILESPGCGVEELSEKNGNKIEKNSQTRTTE